MNYKPFSDEFWSLTKKTLADLKNAPGPHIAAFDADGTLWDTDLGENFFQFQIDQKCVPLPQNPWDHYLDMKKVNGDPRDAYVWLAQINKGQTLEQVRSWSQQAFNEIRPMPVFTEQKKLIDLFLENQVQVYIVTASISWAVEPGARALGLSHENVIGVETVIQNGLVTETPVLPITYRQGKVEALLKKTNGVRPFFASGNSSGDIELLKSATHFQQAVIAASRDDRLFSAENELYKIAVENKWQTHRFI